MVVLQYKRVAVPNVLNTSNMNMLTDEVSLQHSVLLGASTFQLETFSQNSFGLVMDSCKDDCLFNIILILGEFYIHKVHRTETVSK